MNSYSYFPRDLTERYLDALLRRDTIAASAVIDEGLRQGWSTTKLYMEVLVPAQVLIGEMWHEGRVNVAEEHLATQITLTQMERLRQQFRPNRKLGIKVLVACVEGNLHDLGAHMVADFLVLNGFDVEFLGPHTPTHDLVEFIRLGRPKLVGLSLSLEDHLVAAEQVIRQVRRLAEPPRVLVGGHIVLQNPGKIGALQADGVAVDATSGVQEAQRLSGLLRMPVSIEDYLRLLGQRVLEIRRTKNWSQEALAQAAGLDRTYISALEHGKQNLTLGAIVRLADALEVTLEQLLADESDGL